MIGAEPFLNGAASALRHIDEAGLETVRLHVGDARDVIERLPEPFRETLVMRELEDLSYKDIAMITGSPIGTVMSRLARARRMLADMLPPHARPSQQDDKSGAI